MKQHIDLKQLNELSKKGKEKLRKWWKTEEDVETFTYRNYLGVPLLSIGQMIEFLDEHIPYWGIYPRYDEYEDCEECGNKLKKKITGRKLMVVWGNHIETLQPSEIWSGEPELCDALWEAVKEVLEK